MHPETASSSFGQYQLVEKIAQGGMAEIFQGKALDTEGIERAVVIKRILPHIAANPEFVDMLVDEAKIAVMLSHGNIAQIYDLGKVADDYFIVMEYVEGKTLSQIMKRLRSQGKFFPIPYAAYIAAEIANGLDYMHRKTDERGNPLHIIHRDISPQNIILSTGGTVKIIDFGIAKAKTKISTTDSGILKGKFAYMSPEHAEGMKLDSRTDIFSLGIILFEMLTGTRLFKGKNNIETVKKVKKGKVLSPSDLRSPIPKVLDAIVLKALEKDREKRYQSAHDLSQELTRFWLANYSEFTPRELVPFLHDLFPEMAPTEKGPEKIPHEKTPEEETHAADSEVLRKKFRETEVFDEPLPVTEIEEEEESPKMHRRSAIHLKTMRLNLRWISSFIGFAALTIIGAVIWHHVKTQPLSDVSEPVQEGLLPPPAPPLEPIKESPAPAVIQGHLLVDSEPKGAKIFVNDIDSNQTTPFRFDELPSGSTQRIGLHLDRHRFWEGKVQIEAGKTASLSIPLELNYGDLQISSLPEGAEVILNGARAGVTPFQLPKQTPETTFEIVLKLEGYEPWTGQIKIFGGKTEVVSASLKKLPLP